MRFVAQLDPGPHKFNPPRAGGAPIGDYGTGYAFDCPTLNAAAWLWQC